MNPFHTSPAPVRKVRVDVGRLRYLVVFDEKGEVVRVQGENAVRGYIALDLNGRIARGVIEKARGFT